MKALRIACEEIFGMFRPRLWFLRTLPLGIPTGTGLRLRAHLYGLLGVTIGQGTLIGGPISWSLGSRPYLLRIGKRCFINLEVFIDAEAEITLGDGVALGHHVRIITTNHNIGPSSYRVGARVAAPVAIGDGAWLAAGVTVLPGVTIGRGAVVAAGAVVARDVPPNALVGGVPARLIRMLPDDNSAPNDSMATPSKSNL